MRALSQDQIPLEFSLTLLPTGDGPEPAAGAARGCVRDEAHRRRNRSGPADVDRHRPGHGGDAAASAGHRDGACGAGGDERVDHQRGQRPDGGRPARRPTDHSRLRDGHRPQPAACPGELQVADHQRRRRGPQRRDHRLRPRRGRGRPGQARQLPVAVGPRHLRQRADHRPGRQHGRQPGPAQHRAHPARRQVSDLAPCGRLHHRRPALHRAVEHHAAGRPAAGEPGPARHTAGAGLPRQRPRRRHLRGEHRDRRADRPARPVRVCRAPVRRARRGHH